MDPGSESNSKVPLEERRQFVRVRHEVKLSCRVMSMPQEDHPVPVRNLGTGGLLLATHKALALGALLDMRTCLSEGVEFRLHGRVAWTEFNPGSGHHECGICFVGLDQEQRRNVLALLAHGDGVERRRHIRLSRQLLVEYRPAHRLLPRWKGAHTRDVSMGGAALHTEQRLESSMEIHLRIHLDDRGERPWRASAIVVDSHPSQETPSVLMTSVRFMPLEPEMSRRLAAYLSQKLSAKIPGLGTETL